MNEGRVTRRRFAKLRLSGDARRAWLTTCLPNEKASGSDVGNTRQKRQCPCLPALMRSTESVEILHDASVLSQGVRHAMVTGAGLIATRGAEPEMGRRAVRASALQGFRAGDLA